MLCLAIVFPSLQRHDFTELAGVVYAPEFKKMLNVKVDSDPDPFCGHSET